MSTDDKIDQEAVDLHHAILDLIEARGAKPITAFRALAAATASLAAQADPNRSAFIGYMAGQFDQMLSIHEAIKRRDTP